MARLSLNAFILMAVFITRAAAGVPAPELIYSDKAPREESLIGTWEVLPDVDPLAEKHAQQEPKKCRILVTLRQDGTCRVFNEDYPNGSDGVWFFSNRRVFIKFPSGVTVNYYVYGVKGPYMVTTRLGREGPDQLWSRVR